MLSVISFLSQVVAAQDAVEGREIVKSVLNFMDRQEVWKTQPDAYAAAIRRLQQVPHPFRYLARVCDLSFPRETPCLILIWPSKH